MTNTTSHNHNAKRMKTCLDRQIASNQSTNNPYNICRLDRMIEHYRWNARMLDRKTEIERARERCYLDCISGCVLCVCVPCEVEVSWAGALLCWLKGACECVCCVCVCLLVVCCCLYRDRLKKSPKMAFRFPFRISVRKRCSITDCCLVYHLADTFLSK